MLIFSLSAPIFRDLSGALRARRSSRYNATAQRGNPMNARSTSRLRELLARPGCLVAPGVADALAARLVALAGFDAVYMCLLYTSDAADDLLCVDLGGRRII